MTSERDEPLFAAEEEAWAAYHAHLDAGTELRDKWFATVDEIRRMRRNDE